jgi:hypothetical protein
MVHREVLGLFRHEILLSHYPLPPKKRRSVKSVRCALRAGD